MSAWMTEAAAARIRNQFLGEIVDEVIADLDLDDASLTELARGPDRIRIQEPDRHQAAGRRSGWRRACPNDLRCHRSGMARSGSTGPAVSRRIGSLLALSDTADVVDASIIEIARDGDEILTSDPGDIVALAKVAGRRTAQRRRCGVAHERRQ